ncbi:MAG: hypothetical protein P4M07_19245 [Xanthobacteraceae bacterium]|nr:hypothetical protein [Xanthobacteraceae bacterium]
MISCNQTGPFVLSAGAARPGAVVLAACGACLAVALTATEAPARGSFRLQEAWSSEHIARLPAEVRSQVVSVCQNGVARRAFAGQYPDRIVLHYEHLHCSDRPAQCDPGGCLHQEYAFEHGGWHLVKSYHHAGRD